MSSSAFFGINVATQGLHAASTNLDITNHNISNMETEGYSRQSAVQSARRAMPYGQRGMVGTGVEITNVEQSREYYLDEKYWSATENYGEYEVKEELMNQVEALFADAHETGVYAQFSDIYDALEDLSTDPSNIVMQSTLVDSMETLSASFNDIYDQLSTVQEDANYGVDLTVDNINYLSSQIAILNEQVVNLELDGTYANDLRDKRATLIDELSTLAEVTVTTSEDANGYEQWKITLGGQALVDEETAYGLEVVPRDYLDNPEDQLDLYDIYWDTGAKLDLEDLGGELQGYIDIRDGNNQNNFTGEIVSGAGTDTITIGNMNRNDIPDSGEITIGGNDYTYTIDSYDDTNNELTLTLDSATDATDTSVEMGENVDYKGVPYYISQLNEFCRTVAYQFNSIHKQGDDGTAIELFSFEGFDETTDSFDEDNFHTYNQIDISNFTVDERMLDDITNLSTSADSGAGEGANDLVMDMIALRHDATIFDTGEPESFLQSFIGTVGIVTDQAKTKLTIQEDLMNLAYNQRESVMGVDLNEEATDMIRFQQAYNLSAKMISVMDEIFDVTINQLKR